MRNIDFGSFLKLMLTAIITLLLTLLILILTGSHCSCQDITTSIERLNKIRVDKHLPKMVYDPEMQRYCDQYARYIADRDSLIHSNPSSYNECLNRMTLDLDPLLSFQESPTHWAILMLYWDNHICVGTFQKNNRLYVVVRTY